MAGLTPANVRVFTVPSQEPMGWTRNPVNRRRVFTTAALLATYRLHENSVATQHGVPLMLSEKSTTMVLIVQRQTSSICAP